MIVSRYQLDTARAKGLQAPENGSPMKSCSFRDTYPTGIPRLPVSVTLTATRTAR
jgi:hypothetical protein